MVGWGKGKGRTDQPEIYDGTIGEQISGQRDKGDRE